MTMTYPTPADAAARFNGAVAPRRYNASTVIRVVRDVRQLDADGFPARSGQTKAALVHLTNSGIATNMRTVHLAQRIRRALGVE
jgi:hypothetical protein